jgi:hypothetical protein
MVSRWSGHFTVSNFLNLSMIGMTFVPKMTIANVITVYMVVDHVSTNSLLINSYLFL